MSAQGDYRFILNGIVAFDREATFNQPEKWGTFNFEECRPSISRSIKLAKSFLELGVEALPDSTIQDLHEHAKNFADILLRASRFGVQEGAVERENISTQLRHKADAFFAQTAIWLPFVMVDRPNLESSTARIHTAANESEAVIEKLKRSMEEQKREILIQKEQFELALEGARQAAVKAGASAFTSDFAKRADDLDAWGRIWLAVVAVEAAAIFWIIYQFYLSTIEVRDSGHIFNLISTRVIFLATSLTALVWSGRNYKAVRHQATIYRHRALSLQTLQAFAAAASDKQVKDAVLLEAARAVFGNVPTGYIESSGAEGDTKIFEIARSAIPKEGGH